LFQKVFFELLRSEALEFAGLRGPRVTRALAAWHGPAPSPAPVL